MVHVSIKQRVVCMRVRYGVPKQRHTYEIHIYVYLQCIGTAIDISTKNSHCNNTNTKKFSPPIFVLLGYHRALLVERLIAHLFDLLLRPLYIYIMSCREVDWVVYECVVVVQLVSGIC